MSKKHRKPAPPPTAPKPDIFAGLLRLVGAAVLAIGAVTLAMPWLRQVLDHAQRPPPGWVCWEVVRSTAGETERSTRCEAAPGWDIERWDGVGDVAVPPPWRRHYVRD